ncbi:acyltransferase [Lithospermum erythrorhizon]|uniref:Acyltransferase n=1 Tax=Lithospermum erythrorhizon TaxID=34254 RepID=A0AAV3S1I1_LITER
MTILIDDLVKSVELMIQIISRTGKQQKVGEGFVDPTLDPVLLVPGIAGSILDAVDDQTGSIERVWVRILRADREFCSKLWSRFDPSTGKTVSLNSDTHIEVPDDRNGLYAIDVLDPDLIIGREAVYYFHDMIVEMQSWGYQEGTTLFGFGYDFRQSNRLQDTLDRLAAKFESVYTASGGRKITLISHSMGGLLVKCFMSLQSEIFEKYVNKWIAIAAPFQGAPGYINAAFLNGCSFVSGWAQNFFISKWSMHQLLVECPSVYELMGSRDFQWQHAPVLEIWKEKKSGNGDSTILLESFSPSDAVSVISQALSINKIKYDGLEIPLPFNFEILKWANETRKILDSANLPDSVKFYNIYGTSLETPHSVCYGSEDSPVNDLHQLPFCLASYICVDGDGTVPVESAKADGLNAVARVGVPGEHRGILCDRHVFRVLKHWVRADHDPFYNPMIDYVILPTLFDLERRQEKGSNVNEEWEIVSAETEHPVTKDKNQLVGSIAVSIVENDKFSREEAYATAMVVQPQSEETNRVDVTAVSVCVSRNA